MDIFKAENILGTILYMILKVGLKFIDNVDNNNNNSNNNNVNIEHKKHIEHTVLEVIDTPLTLQPLKLYIYIYKDYFLLIA